MTDYIYTFFFDKFQYILIEDAPLTRSAIEKYKRCLGRQFQCTLDVATKPRLTSNIDPESEWLVSSEINAKRDAT